MVAISKNLVAVFGGQGQNNFYFKELAQIYHLNHAWLQDLFEIASKELGWPLIDWITKDPPEATYLASVAVSCPLIGLTQLCHYYLCCVEQGITPQEFNQSFSVVLGHSQGLVSALAISASSTLNDFKLNFAKSIRLLSLIGKHASKVCVATPSSSMLSVNGLSRKELNSIVDEFNMHNDSVYIGLINGPKTLVLCGLESSLNKLTVALSKAQQTNEKVQYKFLPIKAPFHTQYLEKCSKLVSQDLECQEMWSVRDLKLPVVNTFDGSDIRDYSGSLTGLVLDLIFCKQLDWVTACSKVTPTHVIDFGPGKSFGIGKITCSNVKPSAPKHVFMESYSDLLDKIFLPENENRNEVVNMQGYAIDKTRIRELVGVNELGMLEIENDLVVFIKQDSELDMDKVKSAITENLPANIPSVVVSVESIPIDIDDLKEFDISGYAKSLLSESENAISSLIIDILELEKKYLLAHSDFFLLGGDSVTAVLLANMCTKRGIPLTVKDIFALKTIKNMAAKGQPAPTTELKPLVLEPHIHGKVCKKFDLKDIECYPCTNMQQEMYAATLESRSAYLEHIVWKVAQNAPADYYDAWLKVVEKHNVLKTGFCIVESSVFQFVDHQFKPSLSFEEGTLADFLEQDKRAGFSEPEPHWSRATILKTGDEAFFIYTFHHLVYDGWSLGIFFKDFELAFNGCFEPAAANFKPYIQYYYSQDPSKIEAYWAKYLEGSIPSTMFNKKISTDENKHQSFDHSSSFTVQSLQLAAVKSKSTPAIILKAAWGITLQIFASTQDVVFAEVVSGREIALDGIEEITGPTISSVPCRVTTNGMNIIDLLQKMTVEYLEKSEFSAVGLGQIQNWVSIKSLVETLFVFQNTRRHGFKDINLCPINLEQMFYPNQASFPLGLTVFPQDRDYLLNITFLPWNVSADHCWKLLHIFESVASNIIESCVGNRNVSVGDIRILPADLKSQVLKFGYGKDLEIKYQLAHHAFEDIASSNPELVALEQYNKQITYGELNQNAKNLGQFLIQENVQIGEFIPIITSRSFEFIVGIFAVLKAGGAYIPIDNSMPVGRITTIVTEAHAKKALVHPDSDPLIVDSLKELGIAVFSLDCSLYENAQVQERAVSGSDPAYVVFTSGSTGKPKGVVISHLSLANYATVQIPHAYKINHMKWANVVSINFDTCESDIFMVLSNYSTLVLKEADSFDLLHKVDAVHMTPSLLKSLDPNDYPNLKQLIVGGEALDRELVDKWSPIVSMYNTYGPSEITITCTSLKVNPDIETITIGKPLANTNQYIVDKSLNLVPIGVSGELLVGGTGVALGYLYRQDLTDERFIDNVFVNDGSKLYRTGDVCRWTENGEIEFLGRNDDMIKLNGYRIELNEVKNNLKLVESAEVLVIDEKLVAFVTPITANVGAILDLALDCMPFYMVPSVIIPMDSLPLTSNGKVDKKAIMKMEIKVEFEKPETEMEMQLAQIWADLLKIDLNIVGKNSSFFELGGDSILLTRMIKQAKEIGFPLTSALVFQKQTLSRIASLYTKELPKGKPIIINEECSISNSVRNQIMSNVKKSDPTIIDIYPATPMQASIFLKTLVEPNAYCFQITWKINSPIAAVKLESAVFQAITVHPALRTRFFLTDKGVYQALQKPFAHKIQIVGNLDKYLKDKAATGFNIAEYCYFKLALVETNGKFTDLVLSMHHVLYDGWSSSRIVNDIFAHMDGNKLRQSTSIKGLPQYIQANQNLSQDYFKKYLKDARMPDFNPSCYDNSKSVKKISKEFQTLLADVNKAASMMGVTPAMIFKSVWGLVLASFSGKNEVLFGNMFSGRDLDIENVEDIVGCAIHVSPTRLKVDETLEIHEFIKIVQADSFATSVHHPSLSSYIKWSGSIPWHSKLWNSVFYYQNMPTSSNKGYNFGNGTVHLDLKSFYSEFDMNLLIEPSDTTVTLNFIYMNIKPSFASRLVGLFDQLLALVVEATLNKQTLKISQVVVWQDVQESSCCTSPKLGFITPTVLKGIVTPSAWGTIYRVTKLGLQ
ncbi:hypothetical protein HDV01_007254 [Terramyces sp. JEL0728]|nr:hypothetical protein HDV01_007254 [Terramyces sp. JEL0728]